MSWFPTFLNPWSAALAGAAVIPALLILYFLKLRRREMSVPSTLLWLERICSMSVDPERGRLTTKIGSGTSHPPPRSANAAAVKASMHLSTVFVRVRAR